ncbi:CHAT domain-containing protein [Actinoplanes sp. NPDC051851]|uniref:CHAT domain-containing protein n=1 Tax=Actinoplanes sp. NPDC051851 TaxID=3154753 RepID=UPI003438A55A
MSDEDEGAADGAVVMRAPAGDGDLGEAVRAFERLPERAPGRAAVAAGLIEAIFRTGRMPPPGVARAIPALLAAADADPPAAPGWPRVRTAAAAMVLVQGSAADPAGSLDRLEELAAAHPGDPGLQTLFATARTALRFAVAVRQGDPGALSRMPAELAGLLAGLPPGLDRLPEAEVLRRMTAMVAEQRFDPGAIRDVIAGLEPENAVRAAVEESSAGIIAFAGLTGDGATRFTDDQLADFVAHAERPGAGATDRALRHSQVGMAAHWAGRESDPGRLALGIEHLRLAVEVAGPDAPERVYHLGVLATGLLRRHEVSGTGADLREAADVIERATAAAGGPHHPQWQMVSAIAGQIRRLRGDRDGTDRVALDGLRGTVWQVLIQPDLASAAVVVRAAGDQAVEVARQYLAVGDPATAIAALDAGRGLALFAATATGSLADRLAGAGEDALADRWRTAAATGDPEAIPAGLRRDVMTVLTRDGGAADLLDPPSYAEIQRALTDLDADALVYLVPGEGVRPGHAVLAPAAGPPSFLALASLGPGAVPRLDDYLSALAQRDLSADEDGPDGGDGLASRLADIGRWSWDAAMCPLIETYLPRLPVRPDRPPRIVLIPMGDLARIPWQAARRPDGRYAVELIAISQAASARMLVRSAALPAVPLSPAGLVVGDPESPPAERARPLPAARVEAYAIRQAFYPGARYLGRRPDGSPSRSGRGTAGEVRAWLTTPGPAAGAMVHLACHGFVQTGGDRATAYLQLAGGDRATGGPQRDDGDRAAGGPQRAGRDRGRLTADELVTLLGAVPERAVGLVVLAACRTGLSLNGYDEAYSLATAFLAGGARTVVSSQWNVPDSTTSALMFMVHRKLRVEGRPPWAALREAQLWMLDPDREIPAEMPDALRDRLGGADLGAVAAWAAFLHGGQ